MVKDGDRITRDGERFFVVDVKKRVIKARRILSTGNVGHKIHTLQKRKK